MSRKALLVLSFAASTAYFALPLSAFAAAQVTLKGMAVGLLAWLAWRESRMLAAALAFSSLGDVLLEFAGLFAAGLGAFLTAHVIYIFLFRRYWVGDTGKGRWAAIAAIVLYSATLALILDSSPLGVLRIPVFLYVAAITLMAVAAVRATWNTWLVVAGALLFLISDTVLGLDRFFLARSVPAVGGVAHVLLGTACDPAGCAPAAVKALERGGTVVSKHRCVAGPSL